MRTLSSKIADDTLKEVAALEVNFELRKGNKRSKSTNLLNSLGTRFVKSLHGENLQGVGIGPPFDFPIQLHSKSTSLPTPLQNSPFSPVFVHVLPPLQTPSNSPHHLLLPNNPLPKIHVIGPFSSYFLSTPAPFQLFPPKILRNFFFGSPTSNL